MSPTDPQGIVVEIMGQQHQFACPEGQEDALLQAANLLNDKVEEIKQRSGIRNNERALLMVALNLSHELMVANTALSQHQLDMANLINKLNDNLK